MINLPFIKNKEQVKEYFLALLIKPFSAGAILFEEIDSKLLILSTYETGIEKEADSATPEELVEVSDKAVSFVESSLPPNSKLEKTIFSVPYDWVEEGKIKKEYLAKLKKVCEELGLIPMGFIVSIEAIVHFLQKKEGAPISSIFIEVAKETVFVYVVRSGKVIEVKKGKFDQNLILTVEELLRSIERLDVLPSKIVLLDYEGAENVQQEFLSHQWKDIPFLHIPQVVVLEKGFENEATVNGVAAQMGFEVLQDLKAPVLVRDESENEERLDQQSSPEEFGFFKDKDVAKEPEEPKIEEIQEEEEEEESRTMVKSQPRSDYYKDEVMSSRKNPISLSIVTGFISGIFNMTKGFGGFSLKGSRFKLNVLVIAGIVICLLIAFSFVYYNYILKANVIVFGEEKKVEKQTDIKFAFDEEGGSAIKLLLFEEEVGNEESKETTGKKETGEKAKGEVVIYNKTEQKKTFPKGTVIVGANDLEFELAEEVNIASTSSFSTSLSNAKGKVEAGKFGKEYNLPSSTNFTMKGVSTSNFIAKNNDAFSGGTKKETNVVSKKDLEELLSKSVASLEKQALSKARGKGGSDLVFLDQALSSEVTDKKYNKKEGEEAGSVTLSSKVKYQFGAYNKGDLTKKVESLTSDSVPEGFVMDEVRSKIDVKDIKIVKDKSANAILAVNAVFSPVVDPEKQTLALKGKMMESAKKELEKINGITEVQVVFKNKLPLFPSFLPFNGKNITIEKKS